MHASSRFSPRSWLIAIACALALLLAACGGRKVSKDLIGNAGNIPPSFDITLVADKDNQFALDGAPLTEEDLRSALRYRKDQNLPVGTVLLKRGEKEKIKNEHIVSLARVAYQLNIRAFIQPKDGEEISELRAAPKDDDAAKPAPKPDAGK
jgi:hypothetical protein